MQILVVGNVAIGDIGELAPVTEVIDDENVSLADVVQTPDEIATDETGAARDNDHDGAVLSS